MLPENKFVAQYLLNPSLTNRITAIQQNDWEDCLFLMQKNYF
jgi:hypothetical protein